MRAVVLLFLASCVQDEPAEVCERSHPDPSGSTGDRPRPDVVVTRPFTATSTPDVLLTESGVVTCEDPSRRDELAFDRHVYGADALQWVYQWGHAAAAGDFDGDGDLDVLAANKHTAPFYAWEPENQLVDRSAYALHGIDLGDAAGASTVDINGDGHLDVFVTRYQDFNVMLVNDGTGRFEDETDAWGLAGPVPSYSMASSWADMDRDGDLDLVVGNFGFFDEPIPQEEWGPADDSWLYRNNGDGTFELLPRHYLPDEAHTGYTFDVGWVDANQDGYPDLYFVNDVGLVQRNSLVWNPGPGGGPFVLDDDSAGLNLQVTGMGLSLDDLNSDGIPDFTVSQWKDTLILLSFPNPSATHGWGWANFNGNWQGFVPAFGYEVSVVAWGPEWFDIENDGDEDLLQIFGYIDSSAYDNPVVQNDAVYVQTAPTLFEDRAPELMLAEPGATRSSVVADFNNDGYVDIFRRDLRGRDLFSVSRCGDGAWLRVELHAPAPNTRGIGARVEVIGPERTWIEWMQSGGRSHGTGQPPEMHFGLGDLDTVDIRVIWPDDTETAFPDIATRQRISVTRY